MPPIEKDVIELAETVDMSDKDRTLLRTLRELSRNVHNHAAQIAALGESVDLHENRSRERQTDIKNAIANMQDRQTETHRCVQELRGELRVYSSSLDLVRGIALQAEARANAAADSSSFLPEQDTRRHGFPRPPTPAMGFVVQTSPEPARPSPAPFNSERVRKAADDAIERRVGRGSLTLLMAVGLAIAGGVGGVILHAIMTAAH